MLENGISEIFQWKLFWKSQRVFQQLAPRFLFAVSLFCEALRDALVEPQIQADDQGLSYFFFFVDRTLQGNNVSTPDFSL